MQNILSMGQVRPLIGRDDAEQLARMDCRENYLHVRLSRSSRNR